MYGSFKKPRELIWLLGCFIYLGLMAEAFMGYLLPWGQMSYWGAQVITSLFGALPFGIGEALQLWIRGDYVVSDATLNRFFSMHVTLIPLVLLGLVVLHIMALHEVGSNNPDGVEIKKVKDANGIPKDGIPFHPYYSVKDLMGVAAFLFIFALIVFMWPTLGGWFLEKDNFIPANPSVTPLEIRPLWYLTPFYAILRSIPDKLTGVLTMGGSVLLLFLLPWIDRHPVKSVRYRSLLYKAALGIFAFTFVALGVLGTQRPTPLLAELAFRLAELYFLFYIVLWAYSRERSRSFYLMTVVVLLFLGVAIDAIRFEAEKAGIMFTSALLPLLYFGFFLLGPVYTRLNESLPVPERVTWKH